MTIFKNQKNSNFIYEIHYNDYNALDISETWQKINKFKLKIKKR